MTQFKSILLFGTILGAFAHMPVAQAQGKMAQDRAAQERQPRITIKKQAAPLARFERLIQSCKTNDGEKFEACMDKRLKGRNLGFSAVKSGQAPAYATRMFNETPLSTNACTNGEFSQGQSGWTGFRMKRTPQGGLPLQDYLTPLTPFQANTCSQGSNQTCLNIETGGTDPQVPSLNKTYAGQSLVMGGYSSSGYGSESVARKFVKDASNETYPFKYAFSMQASHDAHD